jgi:hypothetical protein
LAFEKGHPFIAFEAMQMFFQSLKVKNTPKKHWNDNIKGNYKSSMTHYLHNNKSYGLE